MITDDILKKHFVHETISQDIRTIYETQEEVIRNYLQTRTGALLHHIGKRPFTSQESESKRVYHMRTLTYLCFLDIRYRRGKDCISQHIPLQLDTLQQSI